jgi:hypothetical protein
MSSLSLQTTKRQKVVVSESWRTFFRTNYQDCNGADDGDEVGPPETRVQVTFGEKCSLALVHRAFVCVRVCVCAYARATVCSRAGVPLRACACAWAWAWAWEWAWAFACVRVRVRVPVCVSVRV